VGVVTAIVDKIADGTLVYLMNIPRLWSGKRSSHCNESEIAGKDINNKVLLRQQVGNRNCEIMRLMCRF